MLFTNKISMKFIFFCIYNTLYRDGKNKVNMSPWFDALGMMTAGTFSWIAILIEFCYFYLFDKNFPSFAFISVLIISFILFIYIIMHLLKTKNIWKSIRDIKQMI